MAKKIRGGGNGSGANAFFTCLSRERKMVKERAIKKEVIMGFANEEFNSIQVILPLLRTLKVWTGERLLYIIGLDTNGKTLVFRRRKRVERTKRKDKRKVPPAPLPLLPPRDQSQQSGNSLHHSRGTKGLPSYNRCETGDKSCTHPTFPQKIFFGYEYIYEYDTDIFLKKGFADCNERKYFSNSYSLPFFCDPTVQLKKSVD